jgi:hypothetical protein
MADFSADAIAFITEAARAAGESFFFIAIRIDSLVGVVSVE